METAVEPDHVMQSLTYFVVVFFFLQWFVTTWWIGRTTGWSELAKHYPQTHRFSGKFNQFGCLKMRGFGGYNNCVCYGADGQGLYFTLWPIFRLGHPPIFLPWDDVTFHKTEYRKHPATQIETVKSPDIPLTIFDKMAERLQHQSGRDLKYA